MLSHSLMEELVFQQAPGGAEEEEEEVLTERSCSPLLGTLVSGFPEGWFLTTVATNRCWRGADQLLFLPFLL